MISEIKNRNQSDKNIAKMKKPRQKEEAQVEEVVVDEVIEEIVAPPEEEPPVSFENLFLLENFVV